MIKICNRILFVFILITCITCYREDEELNNEDLVFTNSIPIYISSYYFIDPSGDTSFVVGDKIAYTAFADTVNNQPELRWDTVGFGIISAVIFKAPIQVTNAVIINTSDIIWQWHNFMESGKDGGVKYSEGKSVSNGIINYDDSPQELEKGDYYWAIWCWNSDGIKIICSSRQRHFCVKE
jgi:hypothetical protein